MKHLSIWILTASVVLGLPAQAGNAFARKETLSLCGAMMLPKALARYTTLDLGLDLAATYDNPFDSDDIDVHVVFTSPQGKEMRVNGFLYQPFTRRLENNSEKIEPAGEPAWKVRFTPDSAGRWRYQVFARDRTGTVKLPETEFEVVDSPLPGFIRRSVNNPLYFARDGEKPFYPVGENVCWGGRRGSYDYDDWLPALSKAGGNFIRIWMCSWNCALEWTETSHGEQRSGNYHNVGVYSLDNAWKLDTILDIAERNGISVMLCFGTYGEFNEGGYFGEGQWKTNPYNLDNGGPCAKPDDFWTNAAARKLYQRRVRYIAARYGHHTNIQSWEFWNEAKAPTAWVAEMARFLKGTGEFKGKAADPYGHLVTTTYGTDEVWQIPEIDLTQTHSYGTGNIADHAPVMRDEARKHVKFGKPHLMGEFGIDWRSPDNKYDAGGKGVNLHNAMWASALSGDAGGAMIWWWDNYVHPKNLYAQFGAFRRFVDTVPWTRGQWKPLRVERLVAGASTNTAPRPAMHIYGLANGSMAIAWIQNAEHHWKNVFENKKIPVIPATELKVFDLASGRCHLEWWDTWKGEVVRREEVNVTNGELILRVPELETDVAFRLIGE